MEVIKLNKEMYDEIISKKEGTTVIDFYADWCGPCKMQAPIVAELAEEMPDVQFCKMNIDEEMAVALENGISSIPTIMVIKNGEVTYKAPGLLQKADFQELI